MPSPGSASTHLRAQSAAARPRRPKLSAESARAARLAAGYLLLAERRAREGIGAALKESADLAVADARRQQQRKTTERLAVLSLLLLGANRMQDRVAKAVTEARSAARAVAVTRLRAELHAAGVRGVKLVGGASPVTIAVDAHHGDAAAQALASAWRSRATAAVLKASRETAGADLVGLLSAVGDTMGARVELTAATEVAQAYNEEKRRAIDDLLRDDAAFAAAWRPRLMRMWDATLDRRTCADCIEHHGETVPVGASFTGDDEPGYVHPRCRCLEVIITL